ncbi:MAG: Do family serine endopeptidase [Bacteroidia bacterium]|nr:Do family serine endopeptidase [Bacteroidia bacterium]
MNAKNFFSTLSIAALGSFIGILGYVFISSSYGHAHLLDTKPQVKFVSNLPDNNSGYIDLTAAAEKSIHAVVHVKTQYMQNATSSSGNPLFDFFYGYQQYQVPVQSSGSGVIISEDGYIVTNNHVIDNSEYIEVVLNDKRSYVAKLIGRDETTDIALLKIDEKNLPYLIYGNSDNIKIGEWVLAAGNPFNLTSTVTAGIVSAKARNINILTKQYAIESFIQTDAAINPGNSGGALVNSNGELVGINTAIASKTGSYVGYSFAIPVNIVKKIVADILEYGEVQRAYLGAELKDIDSKSAEQLKIDKIEGVYVYKITVQGAADEAGIQIGDIILKIQDISVNSISEILEQLSKYRPGEKIKLSIKRKSDLKEVTATLKNIKGNTGIIKTESYSALGAKLQDINTDDKKKLGIRFGLKVIDLGGGKLRSAGVQEGFIIVYINRQPIRSFDDLQNIINNTKGGVYVEGIYPNGATAYYAFGL